MERWGERQRGAEGEQVLKAPLSMLCLLANLADAAQRRHMISILIKVRLDHDEKVFANVNFLANCELGRRHDVFKH